MPLVIDELLVGLALDKAIDGTIAAAKFVRLKPRERLLYLLHKDFGAESQLGRDEFYAFATEPELIGIIDGLVSGSIQPGAALAQQLADRIVPRLHRIAEEQRPALAAEISQATLRAYPLALREFPQYGQILIRKADAQVEVSSEILAIVKRIEAKQGDTDLSRMLVAGPLAEIGRAAAAEQLAALEAAGSFAEAAGLAEDLAGALMNSGAPTLAENYLTRAAAFREQAGDPEAAAQLLERVAWMRCDRRAHEAWMTAHELERLLGDTPLVRGIKAVANWPELGEAADWLRQAIAADEDDERSLRFAAALAEIEAITGEAETVLQDSDSISETDLKPGPRLAIELERMSAAEAVGGTDAADAVWQRIAAWVAAADDPDSAGRAWARRGLLLGRRGDIEGAETAYRRAMAAWAGQPGSEELVAEAFFSMQAVSLSLGLWRGADFELRSIAASLRSASPSAAQAARRLQRNAADARIRKSFPDALRDNWLALAAYREIGSHQGLAEIAIQLADLYEANGRIPAAIALNVAAGRGKEAQALAGRVDPHSAGSVVGPGGAPWERAAAYRVLMALGPDAPADVIEQMADDLLTDSDPDASGQVELVTNNAAGALGEVSLQMPADKRELAYQRLERLSRATGWLDAARSAVRALMRDTDLGRYDATELLGQLFFEERPLHDVEPRWIAGKLADHHPLRERVLAAAREGNDDALTALAYAEHDDPDDAELARVAEEKVALYIEAVTVETRQGQITHHMGINFAGAGMLVRWVSPETQERFVERMLAIAADEKDSEATRASALTALFNIAQRMTDDQRARALDIAKPLAFGHYSRNELDRDHNDPLSRFHLTMNIEDTLHAAALLLGSQLAAVGTTADWLQEAVDDGLRSPSMRVQRGALDALGRTGTLQAPANLRALVDSTDGGAGREALMALRDRDRQQVSDELIQLVAHPSQPVRQLAIAIAGEEGRADALQRAMTEEPNALLKATAERHLARIESHDAQVGPIEAPADADEEAEE